MQTCLRASECGRRGGTELGVVGRRAQGGAGGRWRGLLPSKALERL